MLERFRRNTSKSSNSERVQEEAEQPAPNARNRKDSGGNWRLSEDEDEVQQVRASNPGIAGAEKTALMAQGAGASPQSGTSMSHSSKEFSDVLIPAGASLLDGLRLLLVHHLRASAGTDSINLTAGQAELLEHHLTRLSSYAQKIVHTLAFATRFLSSRDAVEAQQQGGGQAAGNPQTSGTRDQSSLVEQGRRPERKRSNLRLKDRELLEIYRGAQLEASREADWRGLATPRTTARSNGSVYSDSSTSKSGAIAPGDAQLLRVISEAMQQPGRTPETIAAEIVQGSSGTGCPGCQSEKARAAQVTATVRWPKPPPDPGRRSGYHD